MQEPVSPTVIKNKRTYSEAFKRKVVELTHQPGASVAAIALEHGINANLVFKWRRTKLDRKRAPQVTYQPLLLPVSVNAQEAHPAMPSLAPDKAVRDEGVIEVEIGGARVVLRGSVDPAKVRSVLMALRDIA